MPSTVDDMSDIAPPSDSPPPTPPGSPPPSDDELPPPPPESEPPAELDMTGMPLPPRPAPVQTDGHYDDLSALDALDDL